MKTLKLFCVVGLFLVPGTLGQLARENLKDVSTTSSFNATTVRATTTAITSKPERFTNATSEEKVEYIGPIRICKKGTDAELNECFKHIIKDLKPRLADGVEEIQLKPLDPLDLDRLDFVQGSGPIVIKALFTNIKIRGLSNFTNADFTWSSKDRKLNFVMSVPRVRIDGKYTLGGQLLFIPIGGTGPYWFDVSGVEVFGFCKLKTEQRGNKTVAVVDKVELDMSIKDIKIELLNLFNGNQILGPVINRVLNEEGQLLFQEIKQPLTKQIGGIVSSIANSVIVNLAFLVTFLE